MLVQFTNPIPTNTYTTYIHLELISKNNIYEDHFIIRPRHAPGCGRRTFNIKTGIFLFFPPQIDILALTQSQMRDKLLPLVRDENQMLTFIEDYCHYDGYFEEK